MKITFNIGWWIEVERQENNLVLSTSDESGNEMELIIKDGWLNKRRVEQLIEDLKNELNKGKSK